MKVVSVVGARPQFVKAAVVSREIAARSAAVISEVLVHTGQHHDQRMSDVFFSELGMAEPAYNLGIAGGSHGSMTGRMLEAIEPIFSKESPDWVLIYGDTNSTLAAALGASKLHLPVAHVEAGLRSFNMRMPEEINRIVSDRLSSMLFCPTEVAVENLRKEGICQGVHLVGDVMYDAALHFAQVANERSDILGNLDILPRGYVLATCHRAENTDSDANLSAILRGLAIVAESRPVILPLHPRTMGRIEVSGLRQVLGGVRVIEPVSYFDMVVLEQNAQVIVTDSGGVQKEAFFYKIPCVTTRLETEWLETVDGGWNILVGANAEQIVDAVNESSSRRTLDINPYGEGNAAKYIVDLLIAGG